LLSSDCCQVPVTEPTHCHAGSHLIVSITPSVDMGDWSDAMCDDDNLDKFYTCFMTTAKSAFRWRSLALVSLPPLSECKDL
jgi:hypothetical protein